MGLQCLNEGHIVPYYHLYIVIVIDKKNNKLNVSTIYIFYEQ